MKYILKRIAGKNKSDNGFIKTFETKDNAFDYLNSIIICFEDTVFEIYEEHENKNKFLIFNCTGSDLE